MPVIDDNNGILSWSGNWVQERGSTRQWEGGIRATELNGSSVRLTFRGWRVRVMVTLLASNPNRENIVADVNFDGVTHRITKVAQSADVYADTWWDSGTVTVRDHTIIVTYRGDGAHPFHFDSFDIEGEAKANTDPMPIGPAPVNPPQTSTAPRPAQTSTQQPVASQPQNPAQTQSQRQSQTLSVVTQTQVSTIMSDGVAIRTVTSQSTGTTLVPVTGNTGSGQGAADQTGGQAPPTGSGGVAAGQQTVTAYVPSGPDHTGSPQNLGASSDNKDTPVGMIVGSLLGGLFVITLAFILFWLRRRRRRAAERHILLIDDPAQGHSLGGIQINQVRTNDRVEEYSSESTELSVARSSMYTNTVPQPYAYRPEGSETNSDVPPPAYQPSEYDARQSISASTVYQTTSPSAFSSKSRLVMGYD